MSKYILHEDETATAAYQRLSASEGLFDVAFYGYGRTIDNLPIEVWASNCDKRMTKNARRKLQYIWKRLLSQDLD